MDGRIANLHCRYRLLGDPARVAATRSQLEKARDHLRAHLERYADQVFADDPRVIVIRHLRDRTLLALNRHSDTEAPARQWAASITRALTRRVHAPRTGTDEMVIFADQAEFVCQFLADSLPGRQAARHWYYGAFSHYRRHAFEPMVYHLLADNRAHLRPILGQLRQRHLLAPLCRILRGWPLIILWSQAVESAPGGSTEETLARHLLEYWSAAGQLSAGDNLDRIGQLLNTLPGIHSLPGLERFRTLLAERDKSATPGRADQALVALTHRLITEAGAWSGTPPGINEAFTEFSPSLAADWRDRASLTAWVESAIQYLWQRNRLGDWPQTELEDRKRRLERALESFDWLDRPRLRRFLLALLAPGGATIRQQRRTPRQAKLIEALREALFEPPLFSRDGVDISDPGAFRLAAYTALIARHPQWTDDSLAARFIDLLASAVATGITQQSNPMAAAFEAFGPRADALLRDLATAASDTAPFTPAAPLKPQHSSTVSHRKRPATVDSAAAGSLLLLRAIADTRLQQCGNRRTEEDSRLGQSGKIPRREDSRLQPSGSGQAEENSDPQQRGKSPWREDSHLQPFGNSQEAANSGPQQRGNSPRPEDSRLERSGKNPPEEDSQGTPRRLGLGEPFHLLLLPLLARLAGGAALADGRLDPGLALLAGDDTETRWTHWRAAWADEGDTLTAAAITHLWRTLTLQQRLEGRELHLHRLPGDGSPLWVLGDGGGQRWFCEEMQQASGGPTSDGESRHGFFPDTQTTANIGPADEGKSQRRIYTDAQRTANIGPAGEGENQRRIYTDAQRTANIGSPGEGENQRPFYTDAQPEANARPALERLLKPWRAVYGHPPNALALDSVDDKNTPECLAPGGQPLHSADLNLRHSADRQALDDLLAACAGTAIGAPGADTGLSLAANLLLRAWARWLPNFGQSSAGYLLRNAVRRGGRIEYDQHSIAVYLDAAPLDIVIKMAGYLDKMERVPWLGGRDLIFHSRS